MPVVPCLPRPFGQAFAYNELFIVYYSMILNLA